MRRCRITLLLTILGLFLAFQSSVAKTPKYVFLFIGDGMGVNQVNMTEAYLAALSGRMEPQKMCFSQFPVVSFATTYCDDSIVTDSAASGTAIATGTKTYEGAMGLDPDRQPLTTIAEMAKRSGKKVAIMTTDKINGATPSAFHAHQGNRGKCDQIIKDMVASRFDFFAGADYQRNSPHKWHFGGSRGDIEEYLTACGCSVAHSKDECRAAADTAARIIFVPDADHKVTKRLEEDYLLSCDPSLQFTTLRDMLECSVEYLMRDGCKHGFFLMAEGGLIDSQCHGNDAASAIREVQDLNEAVRYAYEFYLKHPKETAIVVTADHETGGLGIEYYEMDEIACLQYQKIPQYLMTHYLKQAMLKNGEPLTWDEVKAFLTEYTGLWRDVKISDEEEATLRYYYDQTVAKNETGHVVDPYAYADNAILVERAVRMLDEHAGVYWRTTSHSAGYVPVYAIGPGTEIFSSKNDNTDIFKKLLEIAKYK